MVYASKILYVLSDDGLFLALNAKKNFMEPSRCTTMAVRRDGRPDGHGTAVGMAV